MSAPTDDPAAVRPAPAALPESPENAPPATAGRSPLPDLPAAALSDLPPVEASDPAPEQTPIPTADLAPAGPPDVQEEFRDFFERHHAELARLAHLLLGSSDGADDLAADALVAVWHQWERVRVADHPAAYARGVVANLARSRIRSLVRERRRVALFSSQRADHVDDPDVSAVVDVQAALVRLPFRKRACVVLRHAFDLSERETARTLGISVGTVKSQTSRGIAELERLLGSAHGGGQQPVPGPQETVRKLHPGHAGGNGR
ncbi:putative sigma factor [Streptomyces bingchenggensis BCW-1]|uniref:Putative sigma factor n=1 Tax=Streptomyces bingchenggensis (strain BCW-1) TaxID=749414 RepID=D7CI75_STRBB|nr:putative sigma factor [Streptomyces bingchenggensis BCW-1]